MVGLRTVVTALAGVAASLLLVAAGSAAAGAGAPTSGHWRTNRAVLPADGVRGSGWVTSVSCPSIGNCGAVGGYWNRHDRGQGGGLLLIDKAGRWEPPTEATLPGAVDPATYPLPQARLAAVSCASAGDCTAVGTFDDSTYPGGAGLLLTETGGKWARGIAAPLPANADPVHPAVALPSVSCAAAGDCVAVGTYVDSTGSPHGLFLTETRGRWARGAESDPVAALTAVSCPSVGNCAAIGESSAGGVTFTETAGRWGSGVPVVLPPDATSGSGVSLTALSCSSAGNCGAIGTYNYAYYGHGDDTEEGLLLSEVGGKWEAGVTASPASDAGGQAFMNSISCPAPGDCVAVGETSPSGTIWVEHAGTWQTGIEPQLPLRAVAELWGVSCASPDNCTVVGDFPRGGFGLLLTDTAGHWAPAREVRGRLDDTALVAVSCPSPLNCGAVGDHGYASGQGGGLLLNSSAQRPCEVPDVRGRTVPRARRSIASHSCSVGTIQRVRSRTVRNGHVIAELPKPGERFNPGTKVTLEVSKGRK